MVRLTDEALRDPKLFNRREGLAAPSVTICDPAVGTGTLGVLNRIAATIEEDHGPGAVPEAIAAAVDRIFGFELQFGPFAEAQLRLIAEMQSLSGRSLIEGRGIPRPRHTARVRFPTALANVMRLAHGPQRQCRAESLSTAHQKRFPASPIQIWGSRPYGDCVGESDARSQDKTTTA